MGLHFTAAIQSAYSLHKFTVLLLLKIGFNNLVRRLWTLARFALLTDVAVF